MRSAAPCPRQSREVPGRALRRGTSRRVRGHTGREGPLSLLPLGVSASRGPIAGPLQRSSIRGRSADIAVLRPSSLSILLMMSSIAVT